MIEIKNLYSGILKGIELKIPVNTIVIGPSGSGKTTLIRCIANICRYEGKIITQDKIGIVLQESCLFPHWTILENLYFPLHITQKFSIEEAKKKARDILEKFSLESLSDKYEVSGGEKQRIAILREILLKRDLILFDEPTSALDPITTKFLCSVIKKVNFIVSTHDLVLASHLGEYFIFMVDGKIIEIGESILRAPKTRELEDFLN